MTRKIITGPVELWCRDLISCIQATFATTLINSGHEPLEVLGANWEFLYRPGDVRSEEFYYACRYPGDLGRSIAPHHPVSSSWSVPADDREPLAEIRAALSQNRPIVAAVDNFYLPFRPAFGDVHAAHLVVVYGFDDEHGLIYVSDAMPPSYRGAIAVDDFMRAWSSANPADWQDAFFSSTGIDRRLLTISLGTGFPEFDAAFLHDVLKQNLAGFTDDDHGGADGFWAGEVGLRRFLDTMLRRAREGDAHALEEAYPFGWGIQAQASLHGELLRTWGAKHGLPRLSEAGRLVEGVAHAWAGLRVTAAHGCAEPTATAPDLTRHARQVQHSYEDALEAIQDATESLHGNGHGHVDVPAPAAPTVTVASTVDCDGKLAAFGGKPAVPRSLRNLAWPVITDDDRAAVADVLDGGRLVSDSYGETPVSLLEKRWADRVDVAHCVGASNGTTALTLAMAALGIGPGDEVIVPALSFIASGLAPLHQMAIPVFADIDPVTFNIDPAAVAALITERTAAILPVHLHGQPADMNAINALAKRHGLAVIEDAAQAHGARYHGKPVGSLGDAGAFSLQVTKNLPTCGEGGLLTVADDEVAARARMGRQFGEVIEAGKDRDYVSYLLGGNHKLSSVQAAFTLSQLDRFDDYEAARQTNVTAFLRRVADLPGLIAPAAAPGTTHAWHILRFRFDPVAAGMPDVHPEALRAVLHRLLRAEGVPVSRYQLMPLPRQRVFVERTGFGRGYPWAAATQPAPVGEHPVATQVIADSLTLQKRHLNPEAGEALQRYADGFEKVWHQLDTVATIARATR